MLATEPVGAELVRDAFGEEAEGAEVMVISPALHEKRATFWVSDDDEAIARAERVQEESVERLGEEGIDAAGDTGEADPLLALQDTLATFEADRILIVTHPDSEKRPGEEGLVEEAQRRFAVPVTHRLVSS